MLWEHREDRRYAFAVGKIRALEPKLFNREKILHLAEMNNALEVWTQISRLNWALAAELKFSAGDLEERYNHLLDEELRQTYLLISSLSQDKELSDLFPLRHDFHNLKVLVKSFYAGESIPSAAASLPLSRSGTIQPQDLFLIFAKKAFGELPPVLREASQKAIAIYRQSRDCLDIDLMLDKELYNASLKIIERNKSRPAYAFFKKLFQIMIAEHNQNIRMRLKEIREKEILEKALLQNEPEKKSVSLFNFLAWTRYIAFGMEPIIAYLYAREREINALRMITEAKFHNLGAEVIKEKIEENYEQ